MYTTPFIRSLLFLPPHHPHTQGMSCDCSNTRQARDHRPFHTAQPYVRNTA
jgi:hypothetical protein